MDGNGRWAKLLGKERTFGHKAGVQTMKKVIKFAKKQKIKCITFFAFSTENWKRPKEEVNEIFNLLNKFIKEYKEKFTKEKNSQFNFSLNIIGDIEKLDEISRNNLKDIQNFDTESDLIVNIAINYGSRSEIIRAVNNIIKDKVEEVDENTFSNYLYTKNIKDPDVLIRTGGEKRLSNFLLYQLAYTELYFINKKWPEITSSDLMKIINDYKKRNRRFGGLNG